jgi:hypothetical protein
MLKGGATEEKEDAGDREINPANEFYHESYIFNRN